MRHDHRLMLARNAYKQAFATDHDVWRTTGLDPNSQAEMTDAGTFPAKNSVDLYAVADIERWMSDQIDGPAEPEQDPDQKLANALVGYLSV